MTTELVFERSAYDSVLAHAREGTPEEVCGVLGGSREVDRRETSVGASDEAASRDGDIARVTVARRVTNVAASPESCYELDPAEQVRVMDEIEESAEVVGFYHSHPRGPDRPSGVDEAQATWAGYSYCIVSLAGAEPTVGSWRWTGEDGGFEAERVDVQSAPTEQVDS